MKAYNGFPGEQRLRALRWLNAEYAAGRRQRPTSCDACTQDAGLMQAHSEDYSSPFGDHIGAFGLCYLCHMMIHCRYSAPAAWERYRTRIRSGWRVQPQHQQSWGLVQGFLRGGDFPWEKRGILLRSLLDGLGGAPDRAELLTLL